MTTIIILLVTALSGLLILQISLLNRAVHLEMQTFGQNVNGALSSIVQKLETQDVLVKVFEVAEERGKAEVRQIKGIQARRGQRVDPKLEGKLASIHKFEAKIDSNKIVFQLEAPQQVRLLLLDSLGQETIEVIDELKSRGRHEIKLPESQLSNQSIHLKLFIDRSAYIMQLQRSTPKDITILEDPASTEKRMELVERILDEYTTFTSVPIEDRIHPAKLDTIVRRTLFENGIELNYAYGIVSTKQDSVVLVNPPQYRKEILESHFKTRLFPHDVFVEPNDLSLFFPRQRMHLYSRLGLSAGSTLFFIAVIVFCFVYVIRAISTQKRFSNRLVEFINNMTHEFKTPISTISLAAETLTQPAVLKNKDRLKKYGRIIYDESSRMRHQVEKILEMAALEAGDFEFDITVIHVHDLIQTAVNHFALRINKRNGRISTDLQAASWFVKADGVHMENIIHNLLDNAVKYTRNNPDILIKTVNEKDTIKIAFRDNGIGLRPDEQKRIFDKYYRVPTGNIHDVKGFGLGLSYVKLVVEAHKGSVTVRSEPGKGSTFEVTLPVSR